MTVQTLSRPWAGRRALDLVRVDARSLAAVVGLWAILLLLSLAAPIDHDEDQYLAAALLAREGRLFVDFLYLQTPLQPYVMAPVLAATEGWSLIAFRLLTATLGLALLLTIFAAARLSGASVKTAGIATLAAGCCHIFLFSTSVVRNDMLPAMLAGGAMVAGIAALRGRGDSYRLWALAGLGIGFAVSTKLSYAFPAAATGLFLLVRWWPARRTLSAWLALVGFSAGLLAGLLPTLSAFLAAPSTFLYGVFEYGGTAPFEWYEMSGRGHRLTLTAKAVDSLMILMRGPALLAILMVAWDMYRRRVEGLITTPAMRFLEELILAGLIAALMPTPTWRQYFIPVLAPLFARAALVQLPKGKWRGWVVVLAVVFAAVGLSKSVDHFARAAWKEKLPAVEITRQGRWIGREVEQTGLRGEVATLSPHAMIDSRLSLMPEFATGPFAYRTGDRIDDERQRQLVMLSPRTVARRFDCAPPAAIITGFERGDHLNGVGLDAALRRYAEAKGYRLRRYPGGEAELYLRPKQLPLTGSC
ncbi:MAG TPA: hypothetical protein VGD10_09840 [Allosphingosinicella sp.]|uniref:ArnT family glycosyltransferase n=1 Tax=Allosphingosinicella sp. TaxID=2823234 RepID=UPI002ED913F6